MERLALFQIGIPGTAANATDALYANGNHQCKLVIRMIKQISHDGSTWQATPLSETEKSSLAVLPCAKELRPVQAKGWYCDLEANQYQQGLWRRNASPDSTAASATTEAENPSTAEQFYRYMRFNGQEGSKQPTEFMACVTLDDGTQYSTYMDNGSAAFDSSVTIDPQSFRPLRVEDLTLAIDVAYDQPGLVGAFIYYWRLPPGLRVVSDAFANACKRTAKIEYAYFTSGGGRRLLSGMALKCGVETLTLNDIGNYPTHVNGSTPVPLQPGSGYTSLRGLWYYSNDPGNWSLHNNLLYWTITDNYGVTSSFILRANQASLGYALELLNNENTGAALRVSEFQIGLVATGGSVTDALYANGRQQCKVFIKIRVEATDNGYDWRTSWLSNREIDSLTILPYSNELRPAQAPGWSCDTEPNKYDEGLWRGTGSVGLTGSADTKAAGMNLPTEVLYRYMRFNGQQARIQPTRFMACITLDDGTKYTTHMQTEGEPGIESSIIITPQNPYSLRVNDLAHERQDAYNGPNSVDVDVNYWTLPAGLRILEESFSGENSSSAKLVYVYYLTLWTNNLNRGMAIRRDVTSLNLNDISSSYANAQIPLINGDCLLRAARYNGGGSTTNYISLTYWTIIDNYGCESRFVVDNNGDGNTLALLNG